MDAAELHVAGLDEPRRVAEQEVPRMVEAVPRRRLAGAPDVNIMISELTIEEFVLNFHLIYCGMKRD